MIPPDESRLSPGPSSALLLDVWSCPSVVVLDQSTVMVRTFETVMAPRSSVTVRVASYVPDEV
jgi:hypothetical protein